jgi:hypothetical protein
MTLGKEQKLLELIRERVFGSGLGNPSANHGALLIGLFAFVGGR